nr:unnamed protein product [Digitaria exilis]
MPLEELAPVRDLLSMSTPSNFQEMDGVLVLAMCFLVFLPRWACGLGSMSSIAVSYGEDGPVFCGLSSDGSHLSPALVRMLPFATDRGAKYSELSAGDNHLCALRAAAADGIHGANDAGSVFNCGLFARNRTVFCWGDETVSGVIGLTPRDLQFQSIGAGGYHVCGVLENAQVFCWGRSLEMQQATPSSAIGDGNVNIVPMDAMVSVVGGRFHACGIKSLDHQVACWGFTLHNSTSPPKGLKMYVLVAGDYFTCGVPAEMSLMPSHGYYEYVNHGEVSSSKVCECLSFCSSQKRRQKMTFQMRIFIAEIVFAVMLDNMRIQPDVENLEVRRAQEFSYAELEQATCGFSEDSQVGKDSGTPLSELPAGTLGYLDPEYYRLHYLTTKSDVYSFGVFLLEILSGRKAIDMQFDEGNIVEWAVPLIKAGDIFSILDPVLSPPSDLEALKKIASVACKCVRMRGKDRPSMDKVTTALEHALALLMGSPCGYVDNLF